MNALYAAGVSTDALIWLAESARPAQRELQVGDWLYTVTPRPGVHYTARLHDPAGLTASLNAGPVLAALEARLGLIRALHDTLDTPYVIPCEAWSGMHDVTVIRHIVRKRYTRPISAEERAQAEAEIAAAADYAGARLLLSLDRQYAE